MSNLSSSDIEKLAKALAPALVTEVHKDGNKNFYIDSETHYKSHMRINELLDNVGTARKIFMTAFIGLVTVGLFVLAMFGVVKFSAGTWSG